MDRHFPELDEWQNCLEIYREWNESEIVVEGKNP
jgi:hypothetical protein